jgi:hypothetical protein
LLRDTDRDRDRDSDTDRDRDRDTDRDRDRDAEGGAVLCLGFPAERQVGVVVRLDLSSHTGRGDRYNGGGGSRGGGGRGGGGGGRGLTAQVMALSSGRVDTYPGSALRFADGSLLEPLPEVTGEVPVRIPDGSVGLVAGSGSGSGSGIGKRHSGRERQFKPGDRVKLTKGGKVVRGCLGAPSQQWVGEVKSPPGSNVQVVCHMNKQHKNPALSYPNYSYSAQDLLLASEFERGGVQALMCGERVQLAEGFSENDGDG